MKILVFTEKPFAPAAVKAIENAVNASGNDLELVEEGTRQDLLEAIKDADGLIVRSDKMHCRHHGRSSQAQDHSPRRRRL